MEINNLKPQSVWQYFAALNAVPRASKKEEKVIAFMIEFGKKLQLETCRDRVGNVIIKKPASPGHEQRPVVVLQAHLDMVHQKNNDTTFDFASQGIEMIVDGDWLRAKGTTLGADNGIGVAAIMAVLAATDLAHPPLEALFTIDEETGMTGAKELDPSLITGRLLLNLDTEEEDELTIGCAGGLDTNTKGQYESVAVRDDDIALELSVTGLLGGHSGMDIHRGRANANKLMNRILYQACGQTDLRLARLKGGGLRNAIPRESVAVVVIPKTEEDRLQDVVRAFSDVLKDEYGSIEPGLTVNCVDAPLPPSVVAPAYLDRVLRTLFAVPNGVFRMSPDIEDLVEASSNLAYVSVADGVFITQSLQRSSVESTKEEVATAVKSGFENMDCDIVQQGDYPGWKPKPDSELLNTLLSLYPQYFEGKPKVGACHAGLECGILGAHFPGMDMISFGPTIRGAHSPDEKVLIPSVARFYGYLTGILAAL